MIKTIISGESNINILSKNNLPSRYCSYELFGIDVLLDYTLKPWLLEVNISPSLHSASPLDLAVKGPLVRELLNIAGFQIPGKLTKEQEENYLETYGLKDRIHSLCYDKRIYSTTLSREERLKHETYHTMARDEVCFIILWSLKWGTDLFLIIYLYFYLFLAQELTYSSFVIHIFKLIIGITKCYI